MMVHGWYYSADHGQLCQVIEAQTLWGETTCRVWLPGSDSVVRFDEMYVGAILNSEKVEDSVESVVSRLQEQARDARTNRRRIMPLFLADNGMVYMPTARHVWDQLLAANTPVRSILDVAASQAAFAKLQDVAEEHGKPIYNALVQEHRGRIAREREKADYAFAARRKTVERIGLPQVRNYRLNLLSQEERGFQEQLDQKAHVYPEMVPLLVIRVEGGGHE